MTKPKVFDVAVLLGGGIDSAALLDLYRRRRDRIVALHVSYGQRAETMELAACRKLARHYRVPLKVVKSNVRLPRRGEEYDLRNAFLILAAAGATNASHMAIGIHKGTAYYDCTERFKDDMQRLLDGYYNGRRAVQTPWLDVTKADVIAYSKKQKVPLRLTYSCQLGRAKPCGKCTSCIDRKEVDSALARAK